MRVFMAVLWVAVFGISAHAQDYPNRPVRLIVPYAAGDGTDGIARFLAKGLEQRLGQPILVEKRPGQATAIGGAHVARSAPDGYTLLMATSTTVAIVPSIYKNLAYDPAKDFSPIMLVAAVPFVLVVHPSLPVNSVMDLVALARQKPGALNYASAGHGAAHHIYAELFKSMTGIDIKHVPYRGGGPALTDLVAGHIPMMFADASTATALIRAGKLRALAVTVRTRLATLAEVPTMHEAGVTGYEANAWQCVVGPANMPAPVVAKLNAALADLMRSEEGQQHFIGLGMQPLTGTPAELGDYIRSEIVRWAEVVRFAGADAK